MANKWVQGAITHPGRIKRELNVPEGKTIPSGKMGRLHKLAGKKGSLGAAARLALRFKKHEFAKRSK